LLREEEQCESHSHTAEGHVRAEPLAHPRRLPKHTRKARGGKPNVNQKAREREGGEGEEENPVLFLSRRAGNFSWR